MKVWITKYALTGGIYEVEGERCHNGKGALDNFDAHGEPLVKRFFHGEGREWHRTRAEAVKRAEDMRQAKLKSLFKAITKLEAKVF